MLGGGYKGVTRPWTLFIVRIILCLAQHNKLSKVMQTGAAAAPETQQVNYYDTSNKKNNKHYLISWIIFFKN